MQAGIIIYHSLIISGMWSAFQESLGDWEIVLNPVPLVSRKHWFSSFDDELCSACASFQEGDATRTNRASISAVKAQQANLQSSNPLLKLLQVLLPLLVILAAIFVPKYLL